MNSFFQQVTHALGWSIVHSIWQGILLYSLLCLVYILLPKLSSRKKYNIAVLGQASIFFAFIVTFAHYVEATPLSSGTSIYAFGATSHYEQLSTSFFDRIEPLFPWFSSVYMVGLFVQLIIFTNSFSKLHYLRHRGLAEPPMTWEESFQRICTNLGINRNVNLFLSEKISVPLTLGHIKPIILFPLAFANNLELKQVESILIHELAHIKRNDYLLNLFKVTIETVLFFNPFVWLFSRHIETEREHACDDVVVEQVPSPIAYAQALMSVELLRNDAAPIYAMAAIGKKQHLLHRIQRITKMEKNYINVKQHLIAVALSSLTLFMVAWISPEKEHPLPKEISTRASSVPISPRPSSSEGALHPENCDELEETGDTITPTNGRISFNLRSDTIHPPIAPTEPPALKAQLKELERSTAELQRFHNSPEWKEHLAKIEANAKQIEEQFKSPAWKQHIADIEANAKKAEAYFDSPEWKQHMTKIEANARKVEDYYNSPEWKQHLAKIEANAKRVEEYYNSAEWKQHIAKIEADAHSIEDYYDSPEWKQKLAKIEDHAKKIATYYASPEWKEKLKKLSELHDSPEYQKLQRKHQQELEDLRLKKGLD